MPVEEMLQTFQNLEESECKNGFLIFSLCPIILVLSAKSKAKDFITISKNKKKVAKPLK
jgi:hypothetical protein